MVLGKALSISTSTAWTRSYSSVLFKKRKKEENMENTTIPGEIAWISVILHLLSSHTTSSLPGQCSDRQDLCLHKGKCPVMQETAGRGVFGTIPC